MKVVLPKIISSEQAGFCAGKKHCREYIIGTGYNSRNQKKGKPPNLVIKLDMMKTYDGVECHFLMHVLRNIGFSERIVNMLYRLLSNICYSILLNG